MKKNYFLFVVAIVSIMFLPAITQAANAPVLLFEDLNSLPWPHNPLGPGYGGFEWNNTPYWIHKDTHPGSGYEYGTIGYTSIFADWKFSMSMNDGYFDFNGAYITAAWNTGQDVTVEGWRDGSLIYTRTIITSYDIPYWFDFDYSDVDTVWFKPGNLGTNAGLGGEGHHILIDNINSIVPEPISSILFVSGGILLAGRRYLKKKA